MTIDTLPGNFLVRIPKMEDVEAVFEMINTCDVAKVGLGVDSQNLTGATRLYDRAGMHAVLQHDTYEKELRPGEELRTQSIAV